MCMIKKKFKILKTLMLRVEFCTQILTVVRIVYLASAIEVTTKIRTYCTVFKTGENKMSYSHVLESIEMCYTSTCG